MQIWILTLFEAGQKTVKKGVYITLIFIEAYQDIEEKLNYTAPDNGFGVDTVSQLNL